MFLGIGDIRTAINQTEHFIGITRIHNHHIRILLSQLQEDSVHIEGLSRTRRAEAEQVGVIRLLILTSLTGDIDGHWHTLPVRTEMLQRCLLRVLHVFLVEQA